MLLVLLVANIFFFTNTWSYGKRSQNVYILVYTLSLSFTLKCNVYFLHTFQIELSICNTSVFELVNTETDIATDHLWFKASNNWYQHRHRYISINCNVSHLIHYIFQAMSNLITNIKTSRWIEFLVTFIYGTIDCLSKLLYQQYSYFMGFSLSLSLTLLIF